MKPSVLQTEAVLLAASHRDCLPDHLGSPLLNLLQFTSVFPEPGGPKWDAVV